VVEIEQNVTLTQSLMSRILILINKSNAQQLFQDKDINALHIKRIKF